MTIREVKAEVRRRLTFLRRGHACPLPPIPPKVADLVLTGEGWGRVMPVRRFSTLNGALYATGELGPGEATGSFSGPYTFVLRGTDGVDLCVGSNEMRPRVTLMAADSLSVSVPLSVTPDLKIESSPWGL